ncbi:alpha/beta hydrolase fold domain-containing protein [Xylophilus rhododendri]|uniref:Alpha/beta hydrolase fold domain-containing protein n=1 Tax=Xylophilus rhododendri TaxID=2697032 RepID=A0A857J9K9_9BURK|nr:alpha/beta hydrolase [Xylophilus rhododendri]QHJ00587.1 alpha/beta hydrolase fold domain-containing protein [Xylophilus rhododendri]
MSSIPSTAKTDAAECVGGGLDDTLALPGRDPVGVRWYGKGQRQAGGGTPLVLHFHGGAFVSGGLENGSIVARILADAGAVVCSLEYPLAPSHPFPAGIETGYAALDWLHRHRVKLAGRGARMFLAGEEAGGNIAAAVAAMARDRAHPSLAGQILLSPMLDPCTGTASLRDATCVKTGACKWSEGWLAYLRGPRDAEHPYAVPSASCRMAGIAPTLVMAGVNDPMHDEAQVYAEKLRGAGVPVTWQPIAQAEGWPDALALEGVDRCPCAGTVRDHAAAFFAATAKAPEPPH